MNDLIKTLEKIIQGCKDIREEKSIHKDARELALLIMGDCNRAIREYHESNQTR
jgi:hypothetical protein